MGLSFWCGEMDALRLASGGRMLERVRVGLRGFGWGRGRLRAVDCACCACCRDRIPVGKKSTSAGVRTTAEQIVGDSPAHPFGEPIGDSGSLSRMEGLQVNIPVQGEIFPDRNTRDGVTCRSVCRFLGARLGLRIVGQVLSMVRVMGLKDWIRECTVLGATCGVLEVWGAFT